MSDPIYSGTDPNAPAVKVASATELLIAAKQAELQKLLAKKAAEDVLLAQFSSLHREAAVIIHSQMCPSNLNEHDSGCPWFTEGQYPSDPELADWTLEQHRRWLEFAAMGKALTVALLRKYGGTVVDPTELP